MINYETFSRIKHLHEQKGLTAVQISRELALDERTVKLWLAAKQFHPRKAVIRPSLLDPFKDTVVKMIESYQYTAQQVYQRIQEDGYTGGYTVVKKFVRKIRPIRKKAFLTLAFAPGECAQVDWGSYGSVRVGDTTRRLSFFVMVLCYSRQLYVEFTVSKQWSISFPVIRTPLLHSEGFRPKSWLIILKVPYSSMVLERRLYLIRGILILPGITGLVSRPAALPRAMRRGVWKTGLAM